jgi:adenylate cyclase
MAHLYRGLAGSCFGRPAARHDIERAITMQREVDPNPAALVVPIAHAYAFQLLNGNISSEDTTLRDTEEALRLAEQCGNDVGLALARVAYGLALLRHDHGDRRKCLELLRAGRDAHLRQHNALGASVADIGLAQLQAEQGGERDAAIDTARRIVEQLFDCGESLGRGPAVTTLVEALLSRGSADDLQEAQVVVERLAATRIEPGFALYEVHLLRLRALVARAHGDNSAYRDYRDRYRHVATSLGFEGHEARAEAMSDGGQ